MTAPEAAVWEYLGQMAPIAAFFGDPVRIYPLRLPPSPQFPSMTYQLVRSPRDRTQSGVSLIKAMFRLSFWGKTYDDTVNGAAVIRLYLEGGDPGGPIHRSTVDDEHDWEPEVQSGLFRRMMEANLWYDPSRV